MFQVIKETKQEKGKHADTLLRWLREFASSSDTNMFLHTKH